MLPRTPPLSHKQCIGSFLPCQATRTIADLTKMRTAAFRQPWIVLGRRYRYTITRMITQADIENMSREEKLRAMEALWQEISKEDPAPESPAWHGEVLEQTRSRVSAGTEQAVDWEEAKRRLRSPD